MYKLIRKYHIRSQRTHFEILMFYLFQLFSALSESVSLSSTMEGRESMYELVIIRFVSYNIMAWCKNNNHHLSCAHRSQLLIRIIIQSQYFICFNIYSIQLWNRNIFRFLCIIIFIGWSFMDHSNAYYCLRS